MSRPRNSVPSYLRHASGRARVAWTDPAGTRCFRMLPGLYDSPESKAAYRAFLAELDVAPHRALADDTAGVTVNEVLLAYLGHAERYYVGADGKPSDAIRHVRTASQVVRELYGHTPAVEFGPMALKAVRQQFVARGWCRQSVNRQVDRVRLIFKWAVAEQLVPTAVHQTLAAVAGLRKGLSAARETEPVGPVADAAVDATVPFLNRHVRGLVEFQRLTGCRPGEAMSVRRCDLDTGGAVWLYKSAAHKTAWKGKGRVIAVGPQAQELLKGFFTPDLADYLFSAVRCVDEVRADRAAKRKTPKYPSHMKRNARQRAKNPRRRPAARYTRLSYHTAVARGCDRAFPPVGNLAQRDDESRPKWLARLSVEQRAAVAAGAPVVPVPVASHVRHAGAEGARPGSGPGAARSRGPT